MAAGGPWTADELATLKKLLSEGRTFREIAAQLPGRSRNACLGLASRLGLRGTPYVRPKSRKWCKSARAERAPKPRNEPKFRPSKPEPERVCFSDDPASRIAAAYFAASDAAQRRRDGYREARRL